MMKIIVYLSPVNDDSGPFEYIPRPFTSKIVRSLNYNYEHIQNETIQRIVAPLNYKTCTGTSGTVIFADTGSIFHRGQIPISSDRFAIFFYYTSRRPKHPFYCEYSLDNKDLLFLSQKLSQHQKQCLLWR